MTDILEMRFLEVSILLGKIYFLQTSAEKKYSAQYKQMHSSKDYSRFKQEQGN